MENHMLVIGLDVGTTGTKAVVVSPDGCVLGSGYREYPLKSENGRVTQKAEDWWDAAIYAVRCAVSASGAAPEDIAAISLSTQAASMLAADKNGNAISPVITWMDTRSAKEARKLDDMIGDENIYRKCGWLSSPVLDAAKIMWLRTNEPEVFSAADSFITTLEYMNIKLTGCNVIDPTNAAMRQMYNIQTRRWDSDILEAVGIGEERLPPVQPIGAALGTLLPEAAEKLGLGRHTQVFNGAHDQYCAAVGCGAVNSGDMLLATGTTWVVLGVTDSLLFTDSHISPGIHPVNGKYGALASLVSAGSALNWYKRIAGENFKTMDEQASTRMESARELFVLPYVCGAGFPHNRPDMRGAMLGLDVGHDKFHIARALMEGVAFEASIVLDQFAAHGMNISKLMMTGGAARSRLWSEIVGYVTGCDIYRMNEPETCCMGAAMIAAVGAGIFADFDHCRKAMVKSEKLPLEDRACFDFYREKGAEYRALVSKLM